MRVTQRFLAGILVCVLTVPSVRAADLPELGDVASNELSLAMEKKIGQQIMNEIRWREPSYLDDPDIENYLGQLGGRLAASSDDPGLGFQFFAIDDPSINAFAMPGGFIGVHTGLILSAQTESELAGVLAHEISHVTQRHIARQIYKSKKLSMASMLAMGMALDAVTVVAPKEFIDYLAALKSSVSTRSSAAPPPSVPLSSFFRPVVGNGL